VKAILLALVLGGCATLGDQTPEVRTNTVTVNVPVPVPCFTEAERPKFPTPTPVNVDTATTEQLAAAELADAMAMDDYTRQVDALFLQCSSKGPTP
jgi:hypothetical protein